MLRVLDERSMSGTEETRRFGAELRRRQGTRFALGHNNGTNAFAAGMYASVSDGATR